MFSHKSAVRTRWIKVFFFCSASLGSTQNLLDPAKMMSMQEDAHSRRISTEVMKNRLYESVVTSPRKRRFSMRVDYGMSRSDVVDPQAYARMVQSLPVSPAHSQSITPAHSPTSNSRYMFGFFSRGATPHCMTPEELVEDEMSEMECEDAHWKGLACLFKPQPRYIPGARYSHGFEENMECDEQQGRESPLLPPPEYPGILLKTVPRARKRAPSPDQDMNGEEPTDV